MAPRRTLRVDLRYIKATERFKKRIREKYDTTWVEFLIMHALMELEYPCSPELIKTLEFSPQWIYPALGRLRKRNLITGEWGQIISLTPTGLGVWSRLESLFKYHQLGDY